MNISAEQVQIGVVYYPEHWERSMWEPDIRRMQETGVKVVRMAEFAWSRMEPQPGIYDWEWLDEAIDLCHRYGLQVVLCTPTATPPRWLTERHPDILPIRADGSTYHAGVRGHRCYSSEAIRSHGERITETLARRYGEHPAVIGWQTDNEFGMNDCHCAACNTRFRAWVQEKYGSLETVNREWGTVVWSGEYSDWSELTTPYGGSRFNNPSYLLDYARFQWDLIADFQRGQIAILRRLSPARWVTHNFHTYPQRMDLYRVGADLDFASFDYYPNTSPDKQSTSPYSGALSLDVTRGIKRRNFWIMEQLSGPPGAWFPTWRAPYPGFIRAHVWQAVARGADTVVHFRWRSAAIGAEQFWHGLLDPSDVPGRRFAEFERLCGEVNRLSAQLQGTEPRHEAAILLSHEQLEALRIQHQAEGMDYYENIKDYHRALTKLGIGCDAISWTEPLDNYRLVIAPGCFLMDERVAAELERFVEGGGTVIVTMRAGVKEMNNQHVRTMLPGRLAELTGVRVEEYDAIGHDRHTLGDDSGRAYGCTQWCDILRLEGAEAIARYEGDFYEGTPAVTVHRYGQGRAYYVATHPDEAYLRELLLRTAAEQGIDAVTDLPEGVQLAQRTGESGTYLFVLNLSREPRELRLTGSWERLLGGEGTDTGAGLDRDGEKSGDACWSRGELKLEPYGVEILRHVTLD